MFHAIVWKEIREQGLIGLMLVVLGSGVLAAASVLAQPPVTNAPPTDVIRYLGLGLVATLMLAVTAGMVCGGAVFAAEREAGTAGFLESLPVSRARLWWAKFVAGLGLAVGQAGLLVGVAAILGLIPTLGWARAVCVFSLLAFTWGIFGSTLARTTLGAVGVAIPVAVVTAVVVLIPIMLLFPSRSTRYAGVQSIGALLFLVLMFAIPLMVSAWLFAAPDRQRRSRGAVGVGLTPISPDGGQPRGRAQSGLSALVWMTLRQLRVPTLILSAFALVCGLSLTISTAPPVVMWPTLALMTGVLTGVIAFADEQSRGSAHFWGEQRLPVGRMWTVKVGLHALVCLWLLVVLALPLVFRSQFDELAHRRTHTVLAAVFRSELFNELGRNGWKYLLVPAAYGFAAGHLCSLLFRKLAVACGVAGILGGVGAMLWMPSLLSGGVHHWQIWLPPALLLLTARLLIPAWSADRLLTRRPMRILAAGSLITSLVLAAAIAYRVVEIPDRPGGEDDIAFVATLPTVDRNDAGREFRIATEQYLRAVNPPMPEANGMDPGTPGVGMSNNRPRLEERFGAVIQNGWEDDEDLVEFLDRLFSPAPNRGPMDLEPVKMPGVAQSTDKPWYALAKEASEYPVGIYEYPQSVKLPFTRDIIQNARRMALALLARGIQQQDAGNPRVFVDHLRIVVALARTMRNGSILSGFQGSAEVEEIALVALDTWLEQLDNAPEHAALLREVGGFLESKDPTEPFDPTPHYLAERYALRESQKSPAQWLPVLLAPIGINADRVEPEVDLVSVAWAVPWERERTRRLVGLGFESAPISSYRYLYGRPGGGLILRPRLTAELGDIEQSLRGSRRAAIIKLALRAFRIEWGKYPAAGDLTVLVKQKYLSRVPRDPYDESRVFGYRLAQSSRPNRDNPDADTRGEYLRLSPTLVGPTGGNIRRIGGMQFVPAGQPILWSVGIDGVDNGGTTVPANRPIGRVQPEDLVYPVPRGPNP